MKKAMTDKTLITVLIFIVVAFLLGFIAIKIIDYITSTGDTEGCRLSVLAASQISAGGEIPVQINCPRKMISLYPEYYIIDSSKKKYTSEEYAENVKSVIAEEMKDCWYKMGEGNLIVLDDNAIVGNDKICFSCSHFEFQEPIPNTIIDMIQYLQQTKIPGSLSVNEQQTYYDYIESSNSSFIGIADKGFINTDKSYELLFLQQNIEGYPYQHVSSYLVLGPSENINQGFCDYTYS
ncbi:MAG: hypothetical protein WC254_02215 [Candidatus Woesearchaeota archaeon]|jgi:hypothetical protein